MLLKFLYKTAKEWDIYSPNPNLPVGSRKGQFCPSGRPPGRPGLDTESSSSLPVDRGHSQRAELSGRSTARSTGPPAQAACAFCARRSARPVDRLLPRSTGPVDRQTASSVFLGFKNSGFYFQLKSIKSYKFHKNMFLLYL